MNPDFNDYMNRIRNAAQRHCMGENGIYHGPDGARRFARECGAALPDFSRDEREINDLISRSYGGICVIAYGLKPPIDAKDWAENMRLGVRKMTEILRRN